MRLRVSHFMGALSGKREVCQKIVYFVQVYILMRLRVFHFMPPYTCNIFLNLKLCTILGSLVLFVNRKSLFVRLIQRINRNYAYRIRDHVKVPIGTIHQPDIKSFRVSTIT
jgi:hypothetical protein